MKSDLLEQKKKVWTQCLVHFNCNLKQISFFLLILSGILYVYAILRDKKKK